MNFKTRLLLILVLLALLDMVIPIPFFALFLIIVTATRPAFFLDWVRRVYDPA